MDGEGFVLCDQEAYLASTGLLADGSVMEGSLGL
jgi:hypothetical protein